MNLFQGHYEVIQRDQLDPGPLWAKFFSSWCSPDAATIVGAVAERIKFKSSGVHFR